MSPHSRSEIFRSCSRNFCSGTSVLWSSSVLPFWQDLTIQPSGVSTIKVRCSRSISISKQNISSRTRNISLDMSSVLNPSYQTILSIRSSIQATLKSELAPEVLAGVVAPFLLTVNQWSTQIPVLLEGTGSAASVNLVFAIRSDLFVAPRFTQNVFGITFGDLPTPFQDFVSFIHKLIEAQKAPFKVCGYPWSLFATAIFIYSAYQTTWQDY